MGKTFHKNSKKYDDEFSSQRSGKHTGKKGGGMKTLNSYVEEDYDLNNEDFDDDIELNDEISIQHNTNTK